MKKASTRAVLATAGVITMIGTLAMLLFIQTFPLSWLAHNDFCLLFYVAGTMTRLGHGGELYLPPGAHSFVGIPFDLYAHRILPGMIADVNPIFLYPPVAGLFFVPFSYLPLREALIVWQVITVLAFSLSALVFSWPRNIGWLPFLSLFTFFPVQHTMLLAQPTALFAFLPLMAGYKLWKANRYFWTGLAWSVLWLKAQALLPLLVLMAALVSSAVKEKLCLGNNRKLLEHTSLLCGFILGSAVLFGYPLLLFGPDCLSGWVRQLNEFTPQFVARTIDYTLIFAGSLACAANILVPDPMLAAYAQLSQVLSAAAIISLLWAIYKVLNCHWQLSQRQDVAFILGVGALPIIATYLRIYDYALLLSISWIYLFNPLPDKLKPHLKQLLLFCWVALDAYIGFCTRLPTARYILLSVVSIYTFVYIRFFIAAVRLATAQFIEREIQANEQA